MKLFYRPLCLEWCACGLLLLGLVLSGCSSLSPEDSTSGNPDAPRFHVGETVIVDLTGTADQIPEHSEPIKEDGTITLPYIGAVQAAGKTPGQLQNEIHNLYVPKYYVRLTVTVKSEDRVYYVGGEVKQPGRQLYVGETTVTKAIQSAGDFTDFASRSKVWLIRANGKRIKVNCNKAFENPSLDLSVYPGDQIQVPRRFF
jgi:polysaccharide export outer membrane protein